MTHRVLVSLFSAWAPAPHVFIPPSIRPAAPQVIVRNVSPGTWPYRKNSEKIVKEC